MLHLQFKNGTLNIHWLVLVVIVLVVVACII